MTRLLTRLVPMRGGGATLSAWRRARALRGLLAAGMLTALAAAPAEVSAAPRVSARVQVPAHRPAQLSVRPLPSLTSDGAVLLRGEAGVRAWATQPGSCGGPAGAHATRAARAAANELLRLAKVGKRSALVTEGASEIDVATPRGTECSVVITMVGEAPERRRKP